MPTSLCLSNDPLTFPPAPPPPPTHLPTRRLPPPPNTNLFQVTKLFKKGGVRCEASSDMMCFTNSTTLALKCRERTTGSGARGRVSSAPARRACARQGAHWAQQVQRRGAGRGDLSVC